MKKQLEALWSYTAFTLIIVGVMGLSWDTFKPGGWLEQKMGALLSTGTRSPLITAPVVLALFFLIPKLFRGNLNIGKKHSGADIFVMVMLGAGAYYVFQWFIA